MRLSPTLYYLARQFNSPMNINACIDFWYDSINDCYSNSMDTSMILAYVEAINDEEEEYGEQ